MFEWFKRGRRASPPPRQMRLPPTSGAAAYANAVAHDNFREALLQLADARQTLARRDSGNGGNHTTGRDVESGSNLQ